MEFIFCLFTFIVLRKTHTHRPPPHTHIRWQCISYVQFHNKLIYTNTRKIERIGIQRKSLWELVAIYVDKRTACWHQSPSFGFVSNCSSSFFEFFNVTYLWKDRIFTDSTESNFKLFRHWPYLSGVSSFS